MIGIGIILSTAFVHVVLPAVGMFADPCFPEFFSHYEGWPGVIMLAGFLVTHLIQLSASHDHAYDPKNHDLGHFELNQKTTVLSLEIGIAIHSVLIGMALGLASEEFIPLLIAISVHQLFEGLALSSVLQQIKFDRTWVAIVLIAVYVLSTPVGVAFGILIRYSGRDLLM
jgi:zinc transporter 1/2/3